MEFFEDDIQAAYATNSACCITLSVVEYIHAISIVDVLQSCNGYVFGLFHMFYR